MKPSVKRKPRNGSQNISIIRKDNDLVEAKYNFDLWESRLFLSLISSLHPGDGDDHTYRIYFQDIKKDFGLKTNRSYKLLREAAERLVKKDVVLHWQNEGNFNRRTTINLIRFVDVLEEGQEKRAGARNQEYVDIAIDKDMVPMLLGIRKNFNPALTKYTSYEMRHVSKLKVYGIRIYELLKKEQYRGWSELRVDVLREMFKLTEKYDRFTSFYKRIIEPSIKDINKYTDLLVEVEKVRHGKTVRALYFTITAKTEQEVRELYGDPLPSSDGGESAEQRIERQFDLYRATVVNKFGVTSKVFRQELAKQEFTDEEIEQAIRVTRRAKYQQRIKRSVEGFFIKALRDGYTDEQIEREKRVRERSKRAEELQEELQELIKARTTLTIEAIRELVKEDPEVTTHAIAEVRDNPIYAATILEREENKGERLTVEDYRTDTELAKAVMASIMEQYPEVIEDATFKIDQEISRKRSELNEVKN